MKHKKIKEFKELFLYLNSLILDKKTLFTYENYRNLEIEFYEKNNCIKISYTPLNQINRIKFYNFIKWNVELNLQNYDLIQNKDITVEVTKNLKELDLYINLK